MSVSSMTLEQFRATASAGGVKGVTLKAQGGAFFAEIATRSGQAFVLTKARSAEPRRFGNLSSALLVLRDVGIALANIDATAWDPDQKDMARSRESRSHAMRDAHEAARFNQQLAAEIEASVGDPRPSVSHDAVMGRMDARIARHKASAKAPA